MNPSPLLDLIDSPQDLRRLDKKQLPQVAAELREFLLESVGQTGGHFASNLGAVELTLALPDEIAEVFRCPNTNCASHGEPVKSRFYVKNQNGQTRLKCHYCEKTYSRDSVAEA